MKNIKSKDVARPLDAAGHDEPISTLEEDYYDRWPVAAALVRTIADAPKNWSTRIGVFGRWGEGKTSVLKLAEQSLSEQGALVIWYSAWKAGDNKNFWKGFAETLKAGFDRAGIPLTWRTRLRLRLARLIPILDPVLIGGASLLQLKAVKVPDTAVKQFSEVIKQFANIGSTQIATMLEAAQARRVVVMIDDLDRANPETIPTILLAVRELLDMPGFSFVLAFDPAIVAEALGEHNRAWAADGQRFIDKIIDFGFVLPQATRDGIARLAHRQFAGWCPFVPSEDLDTVIDAVPENPRKLKLFARTVGSFRGEVSRHNDNELKWTVILLLTLMRMESEIVAQRFVDALIADEVDSMWDSVRSEDETGTRKEALIKRMLEGAVVTSPTEERLRKIWRVWDSDTTLLDRGSAAYQARFAIQPDAITWAEFDAFLVAWTPQQLPHDVRAFVRRKALDNRRGAGPVMRELLSTVVMRYAVLLDRAAETPQSVEHGRVLSNLHLVITLFEQTFGRASDQDELQLEVDALLDALEQFIQRRETYAHFNANDGEKELREREAGIIVELASRVNSPLRAFERLCVGRLRGGLTEGQVAGRSVIARLREQLEPPCIDDAIAAFYSEHGLVGITGLRERPALHFFLTSPDSGLFAEASLHRLEEALNQASSNPNVAGNARLYLQRLTSYAHIGGDVYATPEERLDFMGRNAQLLSAVWRAATAFRLQHRFLQGLRDERNRLLGMGLDEALFPQPAWLQ